MLGKNQRRRKCGLRLAIIRHLREAVVNPDAAAVAEELFATFFDANGTFELFAHGELVDFLNGFVDETALFNDRFIIHGDDQRAGELVETKFHDVFFFFADFELELHRGDFRK
jgi:hypothetical protein